MTIPEAVSLVLQAGYYAESGNIYVSAAEGLTRCKVAASAEKGSVTVSGAVRGKTFRQNGNGKRYLTISARGGNVVLLY